MRKTVFRTAEDFVFLNVPDHPASLTQILLGKDQVEQFQRKYPGSTPEELGPEAKERMRDKVYECTEVEGTPCAG